MRKFNADENLYQYENEYGICEVKKDDDADEEDTYEGYYNGEFFISGSLGEVSRYMEGFIYGLDFYR